MKVWNSFSGEHSANLKIVGKFKTVSDATAAKAIFEDLYDKVMEADDLFNIPYEDLRPIYEKHNFYGFGEHDAEQMGYDYSLNQNGDKLVIMTDETDVQAFLKIMIHKGARIELYSKHTYPND